GSRSPTREPTQGELGASTIRADAAGGAWRTPRAGLRAASSLLPRLTYRSVRSARSSLRVPLSPSAGGVRSLAVQAPRAGSLPDGDDDGGDVVVASARVRQCDETLRQRRGHLALGELEDLFVLHQVGEPVRAEHEEVALAELLLEEVDRYRRLEAHRAGDDVAQVGVAGLLGREDPGL